MTASGLPTDPRASRNIALIGWVLAASWTFASVAAAVTGKGLPAEQQPALKFYALGLHSYSQGPLFVHLLGYSFVHDLGLHLIFNLLGLWAMIDLACQFLTPGAVIRLYSLGNISCGLVYLLISRYLRETDPLIGAGGVLFSFLGAIAILAPKPLRSRLWIYVALNCGLQFWDLRSHLGLSLGMISGLILGLVHGTIETIWKEWNHG